MQTLMSALKEATNVIKMRSALMWMEATPAPVILVTKEMVLHAQVSRFMIMRLYNARMNKCGVE